MATSWEGGLFTQEDTCRYDTTEEPYFQIVCYNNTGLTDWLTDELTNYYIYRECTTTQVSIRLTPSFYGSQRSCASRGHADNAQLHLFTQMRIVYKQPPKISLHIIPHIQMPACSGQLRRSLVWLLHQNSNISTNERSIGDSDNAHYLAKIERGALARLPVGRVTEPWWSMHRSMDRSDLALREDMRIIHRQSCKLHATPKDGSQTLYFQFTCTLIGCWEPKKCQLLSTDWLSMNLWRSTLFGLTKWMRRVGFASNHFAPRTTKIPRRDRELLIWCECEDHICQSLSINKERR